MSESETNLPTPRPIAVFSGEGDGAFHASKAQAGLPAFEQVEYVGSNVDLTITARLILVSNPNSTDAGSRPTVVIPRLPQKSQQSAVYPNQPQSPSLTAPLPQPKPVTGNAEVATTLYLDAFQSELGERPKATLANIAHKTGEVWRLTLTLPREVLDDVERLIDVESAVHARVRSLAPDLAGALSINYVDADGDA